MSTRRGIDSKYQDTEMFLVPRKKQFVVGPPMMLLRLVRASITQGFYDELEAIVGKYKHTLAVPSAALHDMKQKGVKLKPQKGMSTSLRGSIKPILQPGKVEWERTTILNLMRLARAAIENDAFEGLLDVFRQYKQFIHISVPGPMANDMKKFLRKYLRSGTWGGRGTAQRVVKSRCGCTPPPVVEKGDCKFDGIVIRDVTENACKQMGGKWEKPSDK